MISSDVDSVTIGCVFEPRGQSQRKLKQALIRFQKAQTRQDQSGC